MFEGKSLLHTRPSRVVHLGIARTFQNLALFSDMTVLENVLVGAHASSRFAREQHAPPRGARDARLRRHRRAREPPAAGLPFGTLKRVELARALAARPRLLLLDEPAGGLNHEEVDALGGLIRRIRDERGLTVLLVEHHMRLVMGLCDHVHVLNFGKTSPPACLPTCSATRR